MIFDTHAHYDDDAFKDDRESVIAALWENNIKKIVDVGASLKSSRTALEIAQSHDNIYAAVGVHPSDTEELNDDNIRQIYEMAADSKVVAIGEIGLDYHWEEPSPDIQKKWFVRQLGIARELKLPFIIHSRDAAKDTFDIMSAEKAGDIGGVVHCYSYSVEMAREYLKMGMFFGIGGVITFKNSKKLKEVVEYLPMDSIVLETDCPYLSPVPNRGQRNSSLNLPYVIEKIAEIKGITGEEVEDITYKNAMRLYRLEV